jgi:hypothetical protein
MNSTALADLTLFGYVRDGKVFLKGYHGLPDRQIGVVKQSEQASLEYFANRYLTMKAKIDEVAQAVELADNKGSFLMKLIHYREGLETFNGIGDFESLYIQIDDLQTLIREYIAANRIKNTAIKQGLLAEFEALIRKITDEDIGSAQELKPINTQIKELKGKWIKTGSAEIEHNDTFNKTYKAFVEQYQNLKRGIVGESTRRVKESTARMKDLYLQIRKINQAGGGPEYIEEVKSLHNEWKQIVRSLSKKIRTVSKAFKKEVDTFFVYVKLQAPDFTKKTHIEAKKDILSMIEKFLSNEMPYTLNTIKSFQKTWKELGRLSSPEDKDLNLSFRILCNEVFEYQFLERTIKAEYKDFGRKTTLEKINIRIEFLRRSIQAESEVLSQFIRANEYRINEGDSQTITEKSNMVNKIKTKQRILKKLQDEREMQKMRLIDLKI